MFGSRKRVPERRSSLEEREAMRRLRHQRKRIPNSTGHDELEDKVTGGGTHRKRAGELNPAPLTGIKDDKRLIEDSANSHNIQFAKDGLLGRRRRNKREPHVITFRVNLDEKEDQFIAVQSHRKRVSLPALSEDLPLPEHSLAADTLNLQNTEANSKYSYAKNFLLGKREPAKSKRKVGRKDPIAIKIEAILDEAHVSKSKKKAMLPKLVTYVNSLIADREIPSRNLKVAREHAERWKIVANEGGSPEQPIHARHTGV